MNKLNYYKRLLSVLTSGMITLTFSGCNSNKEDYSSSNDNNSSYGDDVVSIATALDVSTESYVDTSIKFETTNVSETAFISDTVITSTILTTTPSTTTTTVTVDNNCYSDEDIIILEHFKSLGDDMKNSLNSNTIDNETLLLKCKSYFIYCVDFLFYDSEINGIKFSDLTDSFKQQLLADIATIDSLICSKFPNYKETISEKSGAAYNKASEIIKAGSENIKDFSKEKLGQDNYDMIGDIYEEFKDQTVSDFDTFLDILDFGKQKVKDWYEGLK